VTVSARPHPKPGRGLAHASVAGGLGVDLLERIGGTGANDWVLVLQGVNQDGDRTLGRCTDLTQGRRGSPAASTVSMPVTVRCQLP
jgi:hypothetical protein